MTKPISEQVVVVTGASSGIGLLTAQEAARRGASVVLAARNTRDLEEAAEGIRRDGGEALAVATDVSDFAQVHELACRAVEQYGRIDSWVNNAAVSHYAAFTETSLDDFRRVMEVNFMGQIHGARAGLPHLEESGGALICVGSALSDRGVPLQGAYCASKHALKGWLDSLRVELKKSGSKVRVTLVKPSSLNTPLFNKAKTQLGVMPRPISPIYDPRIAMEAILHAAETDKRDVYVGGAGKLFSMVERLSPSLLDLQQALTGFGSQQTSWPKSSEAPSNLYTPLTDDGNVRGDFLQGSKRRSAYQALHAHRKLSIVAAAGLATLGAYAACRAALADGDRSGGMGYGLGATRRH